MYPNEKSLLSLNGSRQFFLDRGDVATRRLLGGGEVSCYSVSSSAAFGAYFLLGSES